MGKVNVNRGKVNYFQLQANIGVTNHLGGLSATKKLVELCRISREKSVLNVGCGVGVNSCYIAEKYGSGVMGIDISQTMITKSRDRAKKKKLNDKVIFHIADAVNLPFKNNSFDMVIAESVNSFIEERERAIDEYRRVCKSGGFVGLNEVIWIKDNAPHEIQKYLTEALGIKEILTCNGWKKLLEEQGLKKVKAFCKHLNIFRQWIEEVRSPGVRDTMKAWFRFFNIFVRDKNLRDYTKRLYPSFSFVNNLLKYLGYGLYVAEIT
jgi:ubiquinone/menaquinone biosynthesis C-methylase UbiE